MITEHQMFMIKPIHCILNKQHHIETIKKGVLSREFED
ncbi:hypothetical protein CHCC20335_4338 [Bacillus paralicheniformis]|nr:hypothetical protein CHCC20335_4338 [Bacillus paralicheniformis]